MSGGPGVLTEWLPLISIGVSALSFLVAVDSNRRSRTANTAEQQIAVWRLEDVLGPLLGAIHRDRVWLEESVARLDSLTDASLPPPLGTKPPDLLQLAELERYLRLHRHLGVKLRAIQIGLAEYNEGKADIDEIEETPGLKQMTSQRLLRAARGLEGAIGETLTLLEHLGFVGRRVYRSDLLNLFRAILKDAARPVFQIPRRP